MTISVLMSVYAKENPEWLDRAMYSIWDEQTLKPDEIVLVQDGTLPTELSDVVDKWKAKLGDKLVLIVNVENLGLTKSLNKGIEQVKSKFIARMDTDDVSLPERFEKQVNFLEKHPDIAVLGGAVEYMNESGTTLFIRRWSLHTSELEKVIFKSSPLPHPAVMVRKQIFDTGIRYNEKYRKNQDIALWFELISKGYKIANLPDIILKFTAASDVYKRRSDSRLGEFKIFMNGVYKIKGLFAYQYIYPISRLIVRLLPGCLMEKIYGSVFYRKFTGNIKNSR